MGCLIVLAGGEVMATQTWIVAETLSFRNYSGCLRIVARVKSTDHPAFAFDDGKSYYNWYSVVLSAGLCQSISPGVFVILISYQQNSVKIGHCLQHVEDGAPSSRGIWEGRFAVKVPMDSNTNIAG
jgi:hypothetical protein